MSGASQEYCDMPVQISMSVKDWQWLDATIDNSVVIASVDSDDRAADQGRRIRSAGWRDPVPIHAGTAGPHGRPPMKN